MEWKSLIPPTSCSYILGNPPFGGAKYQTPEKRAQVRRIAELGGSGGTLDYVAAWFITAGPQPPKPKPKLPLLPPQSGNPRVKNFPPLFVFFPTYTPFNLFSPPT